MRIIIILLVIFSIFLFIMRAFGRFIAKMGGANARSASHQQRRPNATHKKTETQEDRIIDYQKKSFEATQAEDVEFEEIR